MSNEENTQQQLREGPCSSWEPETGLEPHEERQAPACTGGRPRAQTAASEPLFYGLPRGSSLQILVLFWDPELDM